MKLERKHFNPIHWKHKCIEKFYESIAEYKLNPSPKTVLKGTAALVGTLATYATVLPFIDDFIHYGEEPSDKVVNEMKTNIRKSLSERGYSSDRINSVVAQ